jgi:N-formylglutamate amidohydrolase
MILHIPHSSKLIPRNFRDQFVLSDDDLAAELTLMTDAFTDELFTLREARTLRFPISRLLVDVERFPDDAEEPMSKVGMGMIYTRTAGGKKLKRELQPQERSLLVSHYETHHQALLTQVENELETYGRALIIDCHSFPGHPLPCDRDQSTPRPEFCIGTDSIHTPTALAQTSELHLKKMGYSVYLNQPYGGTMVPMRFYRKDRRVASIMIEINRSLYLNEITGEKKERYDFVKEQMGNLLSSIKECQQQLPLDEGEG